MKNFRQVCYFITAHIGNNPIFPFPNGAFTYANSIAHLFKSKIIFFTQSLDFLAHSQISHINTPFTVSNNSITAMCLFCNP